MREDAIYYDLMRIRDALPSGRYRNFWQLVGSVHALAAAKVDLERALQSLDLLISDFIWTSKGDPVQHDSESALVGGALMTQAAIFYGRGTETGSDRRSRTNIQDRFTASDKKLHKRYMDLRNNAVAHESGGGDNWVKDTLVLGLFPPNGYEVAAPYDRMNFRGGDALEFRGLIERAINIVGQQRAKKQAILVDVTMELLDDREFNDIFMQCEFDAKSFFRAPFDGKGDGKHMIQPAVDPSRL